jgi:hypothetical protein
VSGGRFAELARGCDVAPMIERLIAKEDHLPAQ